MVHDTDVAMREVQEAQDAQETQSEHIGLEKPEQALLEVTHDILDQAVIPSSP